MGDLSKEPSMEEILSSIKRIIAEDGDAGGDAKASARRDSDRESRRKAVVADMARDAQDSGSGSYVDEVLELTDEMPRVGKTAPAEQVAEAPAQQPATAVAPQQSASPDGMIVSVESEMAARTSLAALSSMIVKPADGSENTLEGMVREMLRPMLKEWLDANLPTLVEGMVAREIARITGRNL